MVLTESAGSTVTVVNGSSTPGSKSGGSRAGIAAGAVVGIIAVAAIIGGVWFYLRARKRRAVEEEYRRNATINSFIKPGSTSSISDSRLEPSVMMQRRMSDGSIADNQDYSRRILKVLANGMRLFY
jgi:cell wall integrity and stress response component